MAIRLDPVPTEPQPVSLSLKAVTDRLRKRFEGQAAPVDDRENRNEENRRHELVMTLRRQLGERFSPARTYLPSYKIFHPNQRPVMDEISALLPNIEEFVKAGNGIIWLGSVGTGKDHLAASLLYTLAHAGVSGQWIRGLDLYGRIRDRIDDGSTEESLLRELAEPAVLCISDPVPGVGELSAWRTEFLHRLVDRRYNALKSTWATLNAKSPDDAKDLLSSQVFDRLRDGAAILQCFWPSWRERANRRDV